MDNKRYQVFVSSTYRDLKEERREVMQALLEMDCIPAGMELFPATDASAWELIKKVIEQSDYYVLIIGGRYGSTDSEGIGFTEKEYLYAVEVGRPVAPFLHGNPGKIPAEDTEMDPKARKKLEAFRGKIENAHHCKFWSTPEDLGGKVARGLNALIRTNPAVGWIRSDKAGEGLLGELNKVRIKNDALEEELRRVRSQLPKGADHLAHGDDLVPIGFSYTATDARSPNGVTRVHRSSCGLTWNQIFAIVGNALLAEDRPRNEVCDAIETGMPRLLPKDDAYIISAGQDLSVEREDFLALRLQFAALGFITIEMNGSYEFWSLTELGRSYLFRFGAISRPGASKLASDTPPRD